MIADFDNLGHVLGRCPGWRSNVASVIVCGALSKIKPSRSLQEMSGKHGRFDHGLLIFWFVTFAIAKPTVLAFVFNWMLTGFIISGLKNYGADIVWIIWRFYSVHR